jgi:ferrochelatase
MVWTRDGSPLQVHTEKQARLLKGWLGEHVASPCTVDYAMRYGEPAIPAVLDRMKAAGCDRILLLPCYPQYAASTTATANDAVFDWLKSVRNQPALRTVRHYHDHPAYVHALAANVRDFWQMHGRPDVLLMSFHGIPRAALDKGDPYHCECQKTGRLLAEALGLEPKQYRLAFQSRFGRAEWLQPYTDRTLAALAREGVRRVDVVAPGFTADCLETLEELAMEGRAAFLGAGGRDFHYIPALNEHPRWIEALGRIALENLGGWIDERWEPAMDEARRRDSARRARDLGALQ